MGNKSTVFKQTIKQKGYWNYSDLYASCFSWLKDAGYSVKENEYVEKNGSGGKEISLDWSADKKVTDYFKNSFSVKWSISQMKDAEIERDGKMVATNKGDLKIATEVTIESDYESRWENSNFWKFMRGLYDTYIIKNTAGEYGGKASGDGAAFVAHIKSFLQLS